MLTKMFSIVAIFAISFPAVGSESKRKQECDVLPQPENVISKPEYSPEKSPQNSEGRLSCDGDVPDVEKLQYEAVNDDAPIFKEATSEKEFIGGAFYQRAEELYISPEPDFFSTRETILNASEVESESEKVALPESGPSAGR